MHKFTLCTATGLSLLLGAAPSFATSGAPNWNLSLVATPTNPQYVSTPDLAFDHYGTPSVSYSFIDAANTNSVQHAQLTSLGLWSSREVANGQGTGIRTSIAFDRSERPTVAWVNQNQTVQAQFNYGSNLSVGGSASEIRPIVSLAYDLAGNLRGLYAGTSAGSLSSISFNGSTFSSAALPTLPGVFYTSNAEMTVDHRGLRQIAARTTLTGGAQALSLLSEPVSGPWSSTNLATADAVDGVSIATDPVDGHIAVAYTTWNSSTNTSKLIYSKFNGSTIATTEILSFNTFRYQDVSLAFDRADDRPAIAFERRVNSSGAQELWYAFLNASSAWQTSLIDSTVSLDAPDANFTRAPSLAFDDYNTSWPAVAYVDSNGALNVAFDPPAPEPASIALFPIIALLLRRRR